MSEQAHRERAIDQLQELGLKEYEAKCFVALTQLDAATAKEISDVSEVPRTRVYDAVRVLEAKGLVEVQHSNPQLFRAVSVDEAAATLQQSYESRIESLQETVGQIERRESEDDDVTHEVWALTGRQGIASRTYDLVDESEKEILLIVGDEDGVDEELFDHLRAAEDRGVTLIVGAASTEIEEAMRSKLPGAKVFVSGLEWLTESPQAPESEVAIGRMLLVDRGSILISSIDGDGTDDSNEKAVFGRGFSNGLVVITRRLMATGMLPIEDPGK